MTGGSDEFVPRHAGGDAYLDAVTLALNGLSARAQAEHEPRDSGIRDDDVAASAEPGHGQAPCVRPRECRRHRVAAAEASEVLGRPPELQTRMGSKENACFWLKAGHLHLDLAN